MDISLAKLVAQLLYNPDSKLLFSSGLFLFLFLYCILIYWILQKQDRLRIAWITVFSLFFYYKCAGHYWILHVAIVLADFYLARWIERSTSKRNKLGLLLVSLAVNLGILVYFKYTNYAAELWNAVTSPDLHLGPWKILLPVGVSFFTFQSLSYTIDVYRGELKALTSLLDYAFFVTFFPQMVAGPIVRAADFLPQIRRPLFVSKEDFGRGIFLFCIGLFKKAIIADYIADNFVNRIFLEPGKFTGLENLFGVYGFAMRIYCDFSGYSDMAIGIALLMGFHFPVNFLAPYKSLSITEFWRRWHISLSTWLRDYLYIPLGGNRRYSIGTWLIPGLFFLPTLGVAIWQVAHGGSWWLLGLLGATLLFFVVPSLIQRDKQGLATHLNLLSTMLLGGLWHGAGNQFLLWGALHGIGLTAERLWKSVVPSPPGLIRKVLGGLLTFHFVCLCWIFFCAKDLETAQLMLTQIFTAFNGQLLPEFLSGYAPIIAVMAMGYLLHFLPMSLDNWAQRMVTAMPLLLQALLVVAIVMLVMQVKSASVQDFIYFNF